MKREAFRLFGFPVYFTPYHFLVTAVMSSNALGASIAHFLLSIFSITLTFLIHELGHAVAFRRLANSPAFIVLDGFSAFATGSPPKKRWQNIVLSLAGPGFGFLGAGIVYYATKFFQIDNELALYFLNDFVFFSVFLNIFNMLPIYPMDGGSALYKFLEGFFPNRSAKIMMVVSTLTAFAALGLGYMGQQFMMMIIVVMIWMRGFQALQELSVFQSKIKARVVFHNAPAGTPKNEPRSSEEKVKSFIENGEWEQLKTRLHDEEKTPEVLGFVALAETGLGRFDASVASDLFTSLEWDLNQTHSALLAEALVAQVIVGGDPTQHERLLPLLRRHRMSQKLLARLTIGWNERWGGKADSSTQG